ncbi:thump domain containing protein [Ophiostoma piceae UAMH 11346]|uniref:Thump domain containing protein n=1 Tax=Ophiostoma piceae (strain UAMH 11346) TaxID=1262450 RepID=S3BQQ5_OPHP1|nr:thump domain containing protein [Ophiostoma piceae UAMH 11346]
MADKRKGGPDTAVPNAKRKKAGNKGKWTTTHQTERFTTFKAIRGTLEAKGQAGMWITCARGMERKAGKEVDVLYQKYAKKMYQIEPQDSAMDSWMNGKPETEQGKELEEDDIEAQVKKELELMKRGPQTSSRHILRYDMGLDCVVFTCLKRPLDPVAMAHQICIDTKSEADEAAAAEEEAIRTGKPATPTVRSCKYVNRLTPVSFTGKATKWGIKKVSRRVLSKYFKLAPVASDESDDEEEAGDEVEEEGGEQGEDNAEEAAPSPEKEDEIADEEKPQYSFSIRASIRRHDGLATRALVDQVAQLIDQDHHKVNLTNPDKVILVEVFKNTLGMSVVDGAWEHELRKFNITAIYNQARTDAAAAWEAKAQAAKDAAGGSSDNIVEAESKAENTAETADATKGTKA